MGDFSAGENSELHLKLKFVSDANDNIFSGEGCNSSNNKTEHIPCFFVFQWSLGQGLASYNPWAASIFWSMDMGH